MAYARLPDRLTTINRLAIIVLFFWTMAISMSLVWNDRNETRQVFDLAEKEALITYNKDRAFRDWAAKHGGVYVPATAETPPNPYLAHVSERDVTLPSGKKLTLMNPAYALREIMRDFEKTYGSQGHITSLKPLNPANAPDAWERSALLAFERGATEVSERAEVNKTMHLRLMRPLIAKQECLKCHAHQGYKIGDVRGGIAVAIPINPFLRMQRSSNTGLLVTHGVIWLLGVGGIGFVHARGRRNIADFTRNEDAILESENRLRTLSNNLPNGLIYQMTADADNRRRFLYISGGVERIHGVTAEAVLRDPMALYSQIVDEDRATVASAEETSFRSLSQFTAEMRIRRPDNEQRWLLLRSSPRRQPDGSTLWDGLEIDITERKQMEEDLRRTNELLERVFTVSHTLIAYMDKDFNFIRVNEAYAAADNRTAGFFPGKNHFALFPNAENEEIFRAVVRTGIPYITYDKPFEYPDHPERGVSYWDWTLQPVKRVDGAVEGLVLILQNVTERKRAALEKQKLEQQLQQAQKMESIGTLAGGVAHDFNNILTAIIGYGNIIKMKMKSDDPLRAPVDTILASAERAANLTQSLLAFSRKQIIHPRPVDLNCIVRGVEKLLHRLIGEDVDLVARLSPDCLTVMADAGQIEQVLMNLATNARDAMPDGGSLTITTQEELLDEGFMKAHGYGPPGNYALITVSDSGEGMDARTRDHIFEPFYTTKELGRGTGLGLSIVFGIIKQHNGSISVYSEPAKGTTFKIYLPLLPTGPEASRPAELLEPPRGGTETILLAEDDVVARELLKTILADFGYRVIEAADGQEAIDLYQERQAPIDLLIVDVIMPRKSGREVYDTVRTASPEAKILFISGYTADIIHRKGIFEEELMFISKPIHPADLARKVRTMLDEKA